jgi:predicted  nucleic acid-binding Zn-ribbon protein
MDIVNMMVGLGVTGISGTWVVMQTLMRGLERQHQQMLNTINERFSMLDVAIEDMKKRDNEISHRLEKSNQKIHTMELHWARQRGKTDDAT